MASPFEIEQAVHELLDQPYDPTTFLPALAQAFGATDSWAKRVADGSGPKSPVADGGVLWVKKFHGLTCAPGTLDARFSELLDTSSAKRKLAFRFAIATDGQGFKALDTLSGETLNCDLDDVRREFWFLKALAGYDDYVLPKESEFDMQASAMLRRLYDTLIRANPDWTTAERQHDLNQFMTRVIFCLFAEDVGIFEDNLFSRTVQTFSDDLAQGLDDILAAVFAVMNVPEGERGAIPPWQAAMFAAHQKLSNMVWIIDNNDLQATSRTQDVLGVEPVPEKFASFGCFARRVDGHSIPDILAAFAEAKTITDRPYVMVLDTRIFAGIDCLEKALPRAHYVAKHQADWDAGLAEINTTITNLERQING